MTRYTLRLLASIASVTSLWLAAPATAHTTIGVNLGITLGAPPPLVTVPGLPVYYAPMLPYNYFVYGNVYYLFRHRHWYYAPSYNGPWAMIAVAQVPPPILAVPVEYYRSPPGHWKRPGPPPWAGQGRGHGHGPHKEERHHGHGHEDE
jgi:hypothetical protein